MLYVTGLREVTQQVVTSIQGHISLTKVLPRLIEDPETTGSTLGDLRELLMGISLSIGMNFISTRFHQ